MRKRTAGGKSTTRWRLSFWRFSIGFRIITVLFHKSVTVVDTISTTVIFCFLLFCRCFLREIRDFRNISDFEQTVMSYLPQLGVPKARLGRIAIVIRI